MRAVHALLVLLLLSALPPAWAQKGPAPSTARGDTITVAELPREALHTLELIRKKGPYPYAKDGAVFGNREGRLPKQKRGYYREYTVKTPGERTRGARRIVSGAAGERWYTADHYASFRLIVE
jgi:ribonuclease T1